MTIATHVKKDPGMSPLKGDPALFITPNEDNVDGILGACVENECMGFN